MYIFDVCKVVRNIATPVAALMRERLVGNGIPPDMTQMTAKAWFGASFQDEASLAFNTYMKDCP